MKIKISSDSTCDLSSEITEKYNISIIPLYIVKGNETLRDGIDIVQRDVFTYFDETGKLCTTAAVGVADYIEYFGQYLKEYDAVIHFNISSEMSVCYQNACLAAQELGNVYVVDSRNLSTGIGHLVMDAAMMARDGMQPQDIKQELDRRKENLNVSFIIDTLTYLHKGGRCSALAALGANLLSLKPCIEVREGKMGVAKKYRGNVNKCVLSYIKDKLAGRDDIDYRRIFITDSGYPENERDEFEACVRECGPFEEVIRTTAGCTISSHCGPKCIGILFYNK